MLPIPVELLAVSESKLISYLYPVSVWLQGLQIWKPEYTPAYQGSIAMTTKLGVLIKPVSLIRLTWTRQPEANRSGWCQINSNCWMLVRHVKLFAIANWAICHLLTPALSGRNRVFMILKFDWQLCIKENIIFIKILCKMCSYPEHPDEDNMEDENYAGCSLPASCFAWPEALSPWSDSLHSNVVRK